MQLHERRQWVPTWIGLVLGIGLLALGVMDSNSGSCSGCQKAPIDFTGFVKPSTSDHVRRRQQELKRLWVATTVRRRAGRASTRSRARFSRTSRSRSACADDEVTDESQLVRGRPIVWSATTGHTPYDLNPCAPDALFEASG